MGVHGHRGSGGRGEGHGEMEPQNTASPWTTFGKARRARALPTCQLPEKNVLLKGKVRGSSRILRFIKATNIKRSEERKTLPVLCKVTKHRKNSEKCLPCCIGLPHPVHQKHTSHAHPPCATLHALSDPTHAGVSLKTGESLRLWNSITL